MVSSLLSLYIASTLSPDLGIRTSNTPLPPPSYVVTASSDFENVSGTQKPPIKKKEFIAPIINSASAIAVDMNSGTVLYEKNIDQRRSIASITKLMTALIILEENELNEVATVSQRANATEGSTMFLRTGEQIAVENLLYGALIHSANDSAVALAEHNAGSVEAFVTKMNTKAQEIGLTNTNFTNPMGLDIGQNYSTAEDVAKLAKHIFKNDFVQHAVKFSELEVKSSDGSTTHKLISTNDLLDSYINFKGLKTGSTQKAGQCFVSIAEKDGNEIITVVLDSPARFTETKILTDWIFRAYNW